MQDWLPPFHHMLDKDDLLHERMGYKYCYQFDVDESLIPKYNPETLPGCKLFLFEIRTSFILKEKGIDGGEKLLDSEVLKSCVYFKEPESDGSELLSALDYRLSEYWMTELQMGHLVDEAVGFANRVMEEAGSAPAGRRSRRVFPVVVNLQVITVQQETETYTMAMDRAIAKNKLLPSYLSNPGMVPPEEGRVEDRDLPPYFALFLRNCLKRTRVKQNGQGMELMPACYICTSAPTIGSVLAECPCCSRKFHFRCLVEWLVDCNKCPFCIGDVYESSLRYN